MLDIKLVALVNKAKGDISKLGNKAKKSAIMAIKEQFAEDVIGVVNTATEGISDAEKIAAFDELLKDRIEVLLETINDRRDEDDDHRAYEAVQEAVFGGKIWDATNAFESLLPDTDDD